MTETGGAAGAARDVWLGPAASSWFRPTYNRLYESNRNDVFRMMTLVCVIPSARDLPMYNADPTHGVMNSVIRDLLA